MRPSRVNPVCMAMATLPSLAGFWSPAASPPRTIPTWTTTGFLPGSWDWIHAVSRGATDQGRESNPDGPNCFHPQFSRLRVMTPASNPLPVDTARHPILIRNDSEDPDEVAKKSDTGVISVRYPTGSTSTRPHASGSEHHHRVQSVSSAARCRASSVFASARAASALASCSAMIQRMNAMVEARFLPVGGHRYVAGRLRPIRGWRLDRRRHRRIDMRSRRVWHRVRHRRPTNRGDAWHRQARD